MALPAFLAWLLGGTGAATSAIAPAAATAAGLAGAGKVAAGLGAAGAGAAGAGGLAGLFGGGAGAGGAMGLLSNPLVMGGVASLLPQLMGSRGGSQSNPDIPESFSDRSTLPMTPIAPLGTPSGPDLYVPGVDPEQRYFQGRYYSQGGPVRGYAGGGMLRDYAAPSMMGHGPVRLQEGGIASLASSGSAPATGQQKQLVVEAARVVKGTSQADPRLVLGQFVAAFGQEALQDLIRRVETGEMDAVVGTEKRMVEGAGDGMSDEVPGTIGGRQDVLLSDGEFVIPADVVSGLGNGSSDAGARQLEDMMSRVRQSRTGRESQAPEIDPNRAMPV